jgi:Zn-dependent M28 family amino/carboxypeptidase
VNTTSTTISDTLGAIWHSQALLSDFETICDFGGRFAATEGELSARAFLKQTLEGLGLKPQAVTFPYQAWRRGKASLTLLGHTEKTLPATSLVFSPVAEGLTLEVVDLGRGTLQDFQARQAEIAGKAVLVRHEFPFSVSHVHRRRKYGWAKQAGAAAFLIANNIPSIGVVTGSSGMGDADDLPSLGISYEAGEAIASRCRQRKAQVTIDIHAHTEALQGEHILVDIPGKSDDMVVLCAHVDGHHLAESAMDNGSGLAVVLEVVRQLHRLVETSQRGLRVMFFTFEEWGLYGSKLYVNSLSETEKNRISLNINLDTVVGSSRLNALVSGSREVAHFVESTTKSGVPVYPVYPLQANSDHYNFFLGGIPSFRLIAGYEDTNSLTRYLLTPADTRDKVDPGQLRVAAMTTASLVHAACNVDMTLPRISKEAIASQLDQTDPWVSDRT